MHPDRVSLVGREQERSRLRALLREHSPVTVVGVGGVGKTRLVSSIVTDAEWSATTPAVCELAGLHGPDQVADAVADALGLPSLEAAAVALSGGRRLLVLDNCEHVVDGAAQVVERLAADCPGVTVLATSREPLSVPGEHLLPLGTLPLPEGNDRDAVERSPAGRLFLELAAAAGGPPVADDGWAVVADLCRCLDGLPLAIELAAARTRSLTPTEILRHLAQRPDVLSRRRDRGPARHRSLEAAIDWSYDRLPEPTRRVFDRLGVFAGRFSADAARSVVAAPDEPLVDVAEELDQLVAQSLLTVVPRAGRSWYGMLDTLRGYARARLEERGELEATRDRWVDSLVATANEVVRRGMRAGSFDAWVTVQTLQGDLLAALRWCLDRDRGPQRAVRLFAPLWWTAYHARADAVAELGDRLLARWPDPEEPGWTEAAAITAFAHVVLGDLPRGEALGGAVLDAPYSMPAGVIARRALAAHAHARGDDEGALAWAEQGIADAEVGDLRAWRHELEALRAFLLGGLGRVDDAIAQAVTAREGAAALGSPTLLGWTALAHGCLLALRDPVAGRNELRPLAERGRELGDHLGTGRSLRALGAVCALDGDIGEAVAALRGALDECSTSGHAAQLRATLRWVAFLADQAEHDAERDALHRAAGDKPSPVSDVLERVHADRLVRTVDGDSPRLPLRDAVALARRELDALGDVALATAVPAEARER